LIPVEFTVETQDPACYGAKGSVVFSATGGVAPYTYYISPDVEGSPDLDNVVTRTNFQFSYSQEHIGLLFRMPTVVQI
jgi:hypothetical protein